MSDETREREFLARSREALDDAVTAIGPATRTRLRAARAAALEAATAAPRRVRWRTAAVLVAAASAAGFAIASWRMGGPAGPGAAIPAPPAPIATTPIEPAPLAATEDLDLYLDLDFYVWLAEQADAG